VKRAPEIAEEILLKVSDSRLPSDLKAFSKALLSKEASDDREKLVAPARMSLAELQKIAHSNGTSLPVVAVTNVDDWADTAASLTKIASRHETENAREIFENATALVATKTSAARMNVGRGGRGAVQAVHAAQPQGVFKRLFGGEAVHAEHNEWRANRDAHMATIPGTKQHSNALQAQAAKSESAAKSQLDERNQNLKEKAVTHTAPLMAAAVGLPMAAMAMRREPAKKEDVRIYK
jgi:hypothetical protein